MRRTPEVADYELLRIYYYDAWPSSQAIPLPISKGTFELAKTERFRIAQSLYDQLVMKPGFALRMGETMLGVQQWRLRPRILAELKRAPRALQDTDFQLDISQKGVDMRIGMDMARLCLRDLVRAVLVVTSDSDFVPAFKFVRREGVKVILNPLGHKGVRSELRAHADFVTQ